MACFLDYFHKSIAHYFEINFSKYLMDIEKTEILEYETIYWININERKA